MGMILALSYHTRGEAKNQSSFSLQFDSVVTHMLTWPMVISVHGGIWATTESTVGQSEMKMLVKPS